MTKTFAPGDQILKEGEVSSEAYLIRSGQAAVWRDRNGEKIHLAIKCDGEIVGEMSLLDDAECSANVTAETEVVAEVITREDLEKLLSEAPDLLAVIVRQLMESLRTADDLVSMYSSQIEE